MLQENLSLEKSNKNQKRHNSRDIIHVSVTKDFVDTAAEFFVFCKEHQFNPSEVIRENIRSWLEKKKAIQEILQKEEAFMDIMENHPWLKDRMLVHDEKPKKRNSATSGM